MNIIEQLFEGVGPLAGLPKHWIKFLVAKYGKTSPGDDSAGEHSETIPIKQFDPGKIRKALKDENNLAVIGKMHGQPLFMIVPHATYTTKYNIFEVTPGGGRYDSKGSFTGRRNRRFDDAYTMNELVDIIDQLFAAAGSNHKFFTIETITKDPKRKEIISKRREFKNLAADPLSSEKTNWGYESTSKAQKERSQKYADIKRPRLDARVDKEINAVKQQLNVIIDQVLDVVKESIKKGETYSVDKSSVAMKLTKSLDLTNVQRLASAYRALDVKYSDKKPTEVYKDLKRTGLA